LTYMYKSTPTHTHVLPKKMHSVILAPVLLDLLAKMHVVALLLDVPIASLNPEAVVYAWPSRKRRVSRRKKTIQTY
jgi:hypothetical protein